MRERLSKRVLKLNQTIVKKDESAKKALEKFVPVINREIENLEQFLDYDLKAWYR